MQTIIQKETFNRIEKSKMDFFFTGKNGTVFYRMEALGAKCFFSQFCARLPGKRKGRKGGEKTKVGIGILPVRRKDRYEFAVYFRKCF